MRPESNERAFYFEGDSLAVARRFAVCCFAESRLSDAAAPRREKQRAAQRNMAALLRGLRAGRALRGLARGEAGPAGPRRVGLINTAGEVIRVH